MEESTYEHQVTQSQRTAYGHRTQPLSIIMMKCLLFLFFVANVYAEEVPMLLFPDQVQTANVLDVLGEIKADDPNLLSINPIETRIEGDKIVASLVIENKTTSPLRIAVYPYGGSLPYGGTTPLTLGFKPNSAIHYKGELFPPTPPLPIIITFPAHTKISFSTKLDLTEWEWQETPKVALVWSFHFYNAPALGDSFLIQLPKTPNPSFRP